MSILLAQTLSASKKVHTPDLNMTFKHSRFDRFRLTKSISESHVSSVPTSYLPHISPLSVSSLSRRIIDLQFSLLSVPGEDTSSLN